MAETVTKLPIRQEKRTASSSVPQMWRPFESLREEIDRLFDDFGPVFGDHSDVRSLRKSRYSGAN